MYPPFCELPGFPHLGSQRQLKFALEAYWSGEIGDEDLLDRAKEVSHHMTTWSSRMPSLDPKSYKYTLIIRPIFDST